MNRLEAMKPAALRATIKEIAELHAPEGNTCEYTNRYGGWYEETEHARCGGCVGTDARFETCPSQAALRGTG